jgi:hypothetical protein
MMSGRESVRLVDVGGSGMAFGQQSGPPATHKQLQYLEALVRQAGHDGFRDARHPLGLTQRQAGGKFTRDEASALIDQLLAAQTGSAAESSEPAQADGAPPLADVPADLLAAELRARGWKVAEP